METLLFTMAWTFSRKVYVIGLLVRVSVDVILYGHRHHIGKYGHAHPVTHGLLELRLQPLDLVLPFGHKRLHFGQALGLLGVDHLRQHPEPPGHGARVVTVEEFLPGPDALHVTDLADDHQCLSITPFAEYII